MEIKSDRRTVASSTSSQAALQRVYVVEAANGAEKRGISRQWNVRLKPWIRLLLLCVPLFSAAATFAQYKPRFPVRLLSKKLPARRRQPYTSDRITL